MVLLLDEEVPQNIKKDWGIWLSEIIAISNFEFPRCIVKDNSYNHMEMHVFADSSRHAYAVTCFGPFIYNDNSVLVMFLSGKCKIYPIGGTLTIPHLELVAAALPTRIVKSVVQESNIKYNRITYWSDSMSTLNLI